MYAVIKQGGHQYKVSPGDVIQVEKIEAEAGQEVSFEEVLLVNSEGGLEIGEPRVTGAAVSVKVLRQGKGRKVKVYKFKRRKGYERRYGHRQPFTEVRVLSVNKDGSELK